MFLRKINKWIELKDQIKKEDFLINNKKNSVLFQQYQTNIITSYYNSMTYSLVEDFQDFNLWNKNHFEFFIMKNNI